jgi:FSR family fosmidomycin resistance protein-like MFS transporter
MSAKDFALKVLGDINFLDFRNDTIQSLIVAIYPLLKGKFQLSLAQIGIITLIYQITTSSSITSTIISGGINRSRQHDGL